MENRTRLLSTILGLSFALALTAQGAVIQHYWDFEGNYSDKSGSADGTAGAQVTTSLGHDGNTAAFFPSALTGGGAFTSAGYVDIDQTQTWSPGTGAFSMSYWFKIADDSSTIPRGIFDFSGDGATNDGPQSLYIGTSGNLAFRIDGTTTGAAALVPVAEDNLWHFVVANYTPGSGIEVHLDGFGVDGTAGSDFGTVTFNADQYLGAFNVNTVVDRGLNGSLDDVAIYEGVLTETEINGLFSGAISPLNIPEPSSALLGAIGLLTILRRRR